MGERTEQVSLSKMACHGCAVLQKELDALQIELWKKQRNAQTDKRTATLHAARDAEKLTRMNQLLTLTLRGTDEALDNQTERANALELKCAQLTACLRNRDIADGRALAKLRREDA